MLKKNYIRNVSCTVCVYFEKFYTKFQVHLVSIRIIPYRYVSFYSRSSAESLAVFIDFFLRVSVYIFVHVYIYVQTSSFGTYALCVCVFLSLSLFLSHFYTLFPYMVSYPVLFFCLSFVCPCLYFFICFYFAYIFFLSFRRYLIRTYSSYRKRDVVRSFSLNFFAKEKCLLV